MKPKITPEEYRNILEALELDTLYLSELNTKFKEDFISSNLRLGIEEKNTFVQEDSTLKVFYSFKLTASDETKTEPAIYIFVKYTVRYKILKEILITKEFIKVFSDITIGMLLWAYFRELVNNTTYRMGMPPLVLPLKKQ